MAFKTTAGTIAGVIALLAAGAFCAAMVVRL